jgi:hypothetical protein
VTPLTISGTATSDDLTANVYDGVYLVGNAPVSGGLWSLEAGILTVGSHSFTATASDPYGNVSAPSPAEVVDVPAVPAPLVDALPPTLDTVTALTISGAAPSDDLTISVYDDANMLGTAPVSGGLWSLEVGILAVGSHSFTATASDLSGNVSAPSPAQVVDVPVVPAPVVDALPSTLDTVTPLTISGAASHEDLTISVYDDANMLGTAPVSGGLWSLEVGILAVGSHSFTATATDLNNNVSAPSPAQVVVVPAVPAPLVDALPPTFDTVTPLTISGTASSDDLTISVYDDADASMIGTAPVSGGAWSLDVGPLTAGPHSLTATASDPYGNVSAPSPAQVVEVS